MSCQLLNRFSFIISLAAIIMLAAASPALADDRQVLRDRIAALSATEKPTTDGAPIAAVLGITKLYELRNWEPAWTDQTMVRQLYDQVLKSVEHGLNPEDFHAQQLGARLQRGPGLKNPAYRADTEILATDALARLAFTLHFGKLDPANLDPVWNLSRTIEGQHPVEAINDVLISGDITSGIESAAPTLPAYQRLRLALVEYRGIMSRGGWSEMADGPGMKPGSTGPRVEALRERLKITGDLVATSQTDPGVYDDQLEAAVKRFQQRHGLSLIHI